MKLRVYYEDTDTGGIVYHSKYINFCERARSEMLFERGIKPLDNNNGFIVKTINASFLKPSKLGDILEVKTQVIAIKRASMKLKQIIYLKKSIVFEMDIELVYVTVLFIMPPMV